MPELFFFENLAKSGLQTSQYEETIIDSYPTWGAYKIHKDTVKVKEFSPNIYKKMEVMNHIIYQFFNQTVKWFLINRNFGNSLLCLEFYYPFARINGINPYTFV